MFAKSEMHRWRSVTWIALAFVALPLALTFSTSDAAPKPSTNGTPDMAIGHYFAEFQSGTAPPVVSFVLLQARGTLVMLTAGQDSGSESIFTGLPGGNTLGALGSWSVHKGALVVRALQPFFVSEEGAEPGSSRVLGGYQRVQCVLERGSDGSWQGPGVTEWVQLIGDGTTEVNLGTMTLIPVDRSPEMEDLSPVVFPLGYLMPIAGTENYNLMVSDMRIMLDAFTIPDLPEEGAKVNCFIQEAVFQNSTYVTSVAVYFNGVWYVDDDPDVIYP